MNPEGMRMQLTRRQFLGLIGALGASPSALAGLNLGGKKGKAFTVAAINDTHVLDARSMGIVNRAVNHINANADVCLTLVLGDLATDGKLGELNLAKQCFDRLEKPYLVVPGNHDVDLTSQQIYGNYERCFKLGNWTKKGNGWLFLGFDSCEGAGSDVTVRADQIDWLRKQVKGVKPGRPIAIFAHHPFNPNTKKYLVKNAQDVLSVFSGHNLKLVATGHWHGNQVEERDGVLFTTTACCSSTRGNFDDTTAKGYRLFHFGTDSVDHEFVVVQA